MPRILVGSDGREYPVVDETEAEEPLKRYFRSAKPSLPSRVTKALSATDAKK